MTSLGILIALAFVGLFWLEWTTLKAEERIMKELEGGEWVHARDLQRRIGLRPPLFFSVALRLQTRGDIQMRKVSSWAHDRQYRKKTRVQC